MQRGHFIRGVAEHGGDASDFGLHTGADGYAFAAAVGDRGRRKCHVDAVAQTGVFSDDGVGVLGDRHAFTRQGRLLDFEVDGGNQSKVTGNNTAGFKYDDVAGDQLFGRDFTQNAFTANQG